jgi:sulfur carrier protein
MALEGKRFAVEVNEMIIPKSRLGDTPICDTDKIEIIHAVGGG